MQHPIEVLGIGSPFMDLMLQVPEEYLQTISGAKGGMEEVEYPALIKIVANSGSKPTVIAGGSCANTIKGLTHFGHHCALLGKVGNDPNGKKFVAALHSLNIVPLLIESKTHTSLVAGLVTPDGQRTFRNYLGASKEMCDKDLLPEHFAGVRLVHIEGYSLANTNLTRRAMELAKDSGALISFDLSSFEVIQKHKQEIVELLKNFVDIVFCNSDECRTLTKLPPEKGIKILGEMCPLAVVSIGREGCWVAREKGYFTFPAYGVTPLDTTGAGDLFSSGFLHGFLTGKPLSQCAEYGARAGAAIVQVLGAELPDTEWSKLKQTLTHG